MKNRKIVYFWFITLVICLPLLVFALVNYLESNSKKLPYYGDNFNEIEEKDARKVGDFVFTNQDNKMLTSTFVKGKIWIACYFFTTCPTICPKMIAGMGEIQSVFPHEDQLKMVSFTVDPDNDKPMVLKNYVHARNINTEQWNLVTGKKKDLYRYARKELILLATDGDGGPQDFIHSDRLVLIDQNSHIRGYYDGTEPSEVKQLIKDIQKLIK